MTCVFVVVIDGRREATDGRPNAGNLEDQTYKRDSMSESHALDHLHGIYNI